jgi:putative transposase
MARQLRLEYPGAFYHVMNRGAGRKQIFHDEKYCDMFLQLLEEINENFGVKVHAYCLMGNHYHLLLETPLGNLSRAMRHLNGVYTQRRNRLLKRDGPLFRGRFKAILVDAENYLLHVSRYIHLNPVEANLVKKPEAYPWSSFRHYCSRENRLSWLTTDEVLSRFTSKNKRDAYSAFISEGMDEKTYKIYSSLKMAPIFGEDSFCNKVREKLKLVPHQEIPDSKKLTKQRITKKEVVSKIAKYYRCKEIDIIKGDNKSLKKIAVYFCQRLTHDTQNEIGEYFSGISYSGISQICKRMKVEIESKKGIKKMMNDLEVVLSNVSAPG